MQAIFGDSAFQYALALATVQTFADYNLKQFAKDNLPGHIFGGIAGYSVVVYILQLALRSDKLYRVNNLWNALTSLSVTVLGVSMGESIKWTQILGVAFIMFGILLI